MLFHLSLPHVKERHGGDVSPGNTGIEIDLHLDGLRSTKRLIEILRVGLFVTSLGFGRIK